MTTQHDVIIVGARCAGAATAMLLARLGYDVALDKARFPSDTASTHAISRGGLVRPTRWGQLGDVLGSGAPASRRVSFHRPATEPVVRAVKVTAGVDQLLAPHRHVFDTIMVDATMTAGARVHLGLTVTGLRREALALAAAPQLEMPVAA